MKAKRNRTRLWFGLGVAVFAPLAIAVGLALGQSRIYYFNGVPYVFPTSQELAGEVLTNDGAGNLDWASVPTSEGLWSGAVVMSSISCPTGWTRLSAADDRFLRAAATAGTTGGSDTHSHTISGATAAQGVTISGSTASTAPGISGSTASTDISHTHGASTPGSGFASGETSALTSVTVQSGGGSHSHGAGTLSGSSHSHGAGTLAGASHTHAPGSLAAASASNVPAFFQVILCVKD